MKAMNKRLLFILPIFLLLSSCTTLDSVDSVHIDTIDLKEPRDSTGSLLDTEEFVAEKASEVEKTVAAGPAAQKSGQSSVELPKHELINKKEPVINYIDLDKNLEDLFRISINLEGVDIRDAMTMLSEVTGKNILVGDEVSGTVSVRLVDVPWNKALDAILQIKKLAKHVNEEGTIIRIHQQEALIAQEAFERKRREDLLATLKTEQSIGALYTEIFRLYYTDPTVVKKEIQEALGFGGEGGAGEGESAGGVAGYSVQIAVDTRIKSLIITGNREDLDAIASLIERIDIRTQQVLIEAFIVEATDDFSKELGTRLGFDDKAFLEGGGGETIRTDVIGVAGALPAVGTDIAVGDNTGLITNFPVAGGAGIGLLIKRAATILKAELTAMEKLGITKIISNPRVFTLDNEEAVIIQGDEIPFTSTNAQGGTQVQFKEAGIQLKVTPSIVGDGNVILDVIVEKKSADTSIANPPITTRQITTKLLVRDNTIVVIGGVFTQSTAEAESQLPILGDIPVLGKMFKYQKETDTRKELLVFLAPRIL